MTTVVHHQTLPHIPGKALCHFAAPGAEVTVTDDADEVTCKECLAMLRVTGLVAEKENSGEEEA
jgi:hypothetical protein